MLDCSANFKILFKSYPILIQSFKKLNNAFIIEEYFQTELNTKHFFTIRKDSIKLSFPNILSPIQIIKDTDNNGAFKLNIVKPDLIYLDSLFILQYNKSFINTLKLEYINLLIEYYIEEILGYSCKKHFKAIKELENKNSFIKVTFYNYKKGLKELRGIFNKESGDINIELIGPEEDIKSNIEILEKIIGIKNPTN